MLLPPSSPPVDEYHNIWSLPQKSLETSPTCYFFYLFIFFLKQCSVVSTFTISYKTLHTHLVRIRVEFVFFKRSQVFFDVRHFIRVEGHEELKKIVQSKI